MLQLLFALRVLQIDLCRGLTVSRCRAFLHASPTWLAPSSTLMLYRDVYRQVEDARLGQLFFFNFRRGQLMPRVSLGTREA